MINDPEIDLTEHQDFKKQTDISPLFRIVGNKQVTNITAYAEYMFRKEVFGEEFPWNIMPKYHKFKYDGLVALGNKEEREEAILSRTWGTTENIICDCCGKEYIKIPWKKNWGLCENCNKGYNVPQSIPWKM